MTRDEQYAGMTRDEQYAGMTRDEHVRTREELPERPTDSLPLVRGRAGWR